MPLLNKITYNIKNSLFYRFLKKFYYCYFYKSKNDKWFQNCLKQYKNLDTSQRFSIKEEDFWIILGENTATTSFDSHYEYHQAWAARCLAKINPKKHTDISSKITFNGVVSAFIPIDFYDYRPAQIHLENLYCGQADLTNLHFEDNSIESLSCMHTIEHIGLGRYGDEIDPSGDLKAMSELKRVVKKGGSLLFVTPVGKPRIQYNAHRIYSLDMILEYFKGFQLVEFALIPDNAMEVGMIKNASIQTVAEQNYACGCFWFKKE